MFTAIAAWFAAKWMNVLPWALGIAGVVIGLVGVRESGKDAAYAEVNKQALLKANMALKITQSVSAMSDADVDNILRTRFSAR